MSPTLSKSTPTFHPGKFSWFSLLTKAWVGVISTSNGQKLPKKKYLQEVVSYCGQSVLVVVLGIPADHSYSEAFYTQGGLQSTSLIFNAHLKTFQQELTSWKTFQQELTSWECKRYELRSCQSAEDLWASGQISKQTRILRSENKSLRDAFGIAHMTFVQLYNYGR